MTTPDARMWNEAVEILATMHCNIRCRWCALASPTSPDRFAKPGTVAEDLAQLAKWLVVDHVRILGGEPLLHPALLEIVAAIRAARLAPKIRIVTNGVLLDRMPVELWERVDEIQISRYPATGSAVDRKLEKLLSIAVECGTRLTVEHYEFFRVSYREPGSDAVLTNRIYKTCQIANQWRSLTADNGRLYRCPQSVNIQTDPAYAAQTGVHGLDFLEIPRIRSVSDILTWLDPPGALKSCEVCAGSVGRREEHQQIRRGTPADGPDVIDYARLETLERSPVIDNECVVQMDLLSMPRLGDVAGGVRGQEQVVVS